VCTTKDFVMGNREKTARPARLPPAGVRVQVRTCEVAACRCLFVDSKSVGPERIRKVWGRCLFVDSKSVGPERGWGTVGTRATEGTRRKDRNLLFLQLFRHLSILRPSLHKHKTDAMQQLSITCALILPAYLLQSPLYLATVPRVTAHTLLLSACASIEF
jgi:hypothetical protein